MRMIVQSLEKKEGESELVLLGEGGRDSIIETTTTAR